ncbi:MAG: histidinol-phosphate transaminase [Proteobacteria bacterium]|nr:histidinol-phosphate transaminase [Pseudomonadota bacterium]
MTSAQAAVSALELCRAQARALPAYNAGLSETLVRKRYRVAQVRKLASNENPHGASPAVAAAIRDWSARAHRYPDPACTALREGLQQWTGVDAARIVAGNGSEELIERICLAFLCAGDRTVTLSPSFGLHEIFPLMMGAQVTKVPVDARFAHDLAAWRAALAQPTKLVMFSTPSNPLGCAASRVELQQIIAAAPRNVLLVIDEAYHEYAAGPGYPDVLQLLAQQPRPWVVLRTFSKAFGLAGLRVGYALTSETELRAIIERVGTPFNVNGAAQVAALAALTDREHLRSVVAATARERQALVGALASLESARQPGLRVVPSCANFLFIDTARSARQVAEALLARGVIVKPWLEPGFQTFIRVTIGEGGENDAFVTALADVLPQIPPAPPG